MTAWRRDKDTDTGIPRLNRKGGGEIENKYDFSAENEMKVTPHTQQGQSHKRFMGRSAFNRDSLTRLTAGSAFKRDSLTRFTATEQGEELQVQNTTNAYVCALNS